MASANNQSNLFGENSSSSDESVGGGGAAPAAKEATTSTRTKIGDDDSSSDDEPKKPAAAADGDGATAKDGDTEDKKDDDDEKAKDGGTPSKNNNSALFGEDDSSEDDEFDGDDGIVGRKGGNAVMPKAPEAGRSMNQKLGLESDSDDDKEGTKSDEKIEEKEKKAYVPPRRMELLKINENADKPASQQPIYHITKLPNLVGIQPRPYNAATHDLEKEEEQYRGYVHNMIRWRYKTDDNGEYIRDKDGNPLRESNTRWVKWSDGSYTLHIGSEVLDVDNLDSSVPKDHPDKEMAGFAGINGYLHVSQKAKIRPPSKKEMEGPPKDGDSEEDEEDLPEAKSAGTVLECIAPITSRLAPRPSSLTSDAHRNLTLAMRQRNVKRARIAEIVTEVDPEKEKQARIKGKDDLAKSRSRSSGGRRSGGGGGGRRRGMNASYLEEGDDYDGVNLSRLKKQTMRRDKYSDEEDDEEEIDYGDSEEEEDEWSSKKKRKRGAAAARASKEKEKPANSKMDDSESSEEGEVVFGDDDDDDEEDTAFAKKRGGAGGGAKKAVFGDDDDDSS